MAAVQALAPAAAAFPSPAKSRSSSMTAASWGAGALHQRLNTFVKKSLIQQLVPTSAVICDLYCGRGVDTQTWAEAEIGKYVGVDLSSSALEEAKEQWEKNGKPFVARFCELNPCMVDLENNLGEDRLSADIVTCLAHLQDCFASEDMVHQLLKNVASLLKPGGYFFGATPDSSTIWYKYQKAVEGAMKAGSLRANGQLPRVKTDLYSISFEDDRFNQYGSRYQLRFTDDTVPPQPQILVHFPSLIRLAEELGLEFVEIQNLTEFYEDYRVPFAETLQKTCGTLVDGKGNPVVDGKSRLSPIAQDVLSLYTTFIFKKPDPEQRLRALKRAAAAFVPAPAPAPPLADVKKHKKSSPALTVRVPATPEEMSAKKRKLLASPAVATLNGSKVQEKQEKTPSKAKPETVVKVEPGRPFVTPESRALPSMPKTEIPSPNKPRASQGQRSESPSASKVKATGGPSPIASKPPASFTQSIASPKPKAFEGGPSPIASKPPASISQSIASPKPRAFEEGQRSESPNVRVQELKSSEVALKSSIPENSDTDRPTSSVVLPESLQKIDTPLVETQPPGPESASKQRTVKKKRVSRWSSELVPKKTPEQLPRFDTIPGAAQVFNAVLQAGVIAGAMAGASKDGKSREDSRFYNNANRDPNRPSRSLFLRKSPLPKQEHSNGKERTPNREENSAPRLAERESQVKEEGEIVPEPPVHRTSSPKRDRPPGGTDLHYERRTAQRTRSETATRNTGSIGSETRLDPNSESQAGPAVSEKGDARPNEGSIQETESTKPEATAQSTADQGKRGVLSADRGNPPSSEAKQESPSVKSRGKDVDMAVLMERTGCQSQGDAAAATPATEEGVAKTVTEAAVKDKSAASTAPPQAGQKKDFDVEFEKGSKLSRDSPAATAAAAGDQLFKAGSSSSDRGKMNNQGSKREFEPAWETKPQRYTQRRAAAMAEGPLDSPNPQAWSNRGAFPKVNNRDQLPGRGPVYLPRMPYVNSVPGFAPRPPIRAAERGRLPGVVAPLPVGLPGLLGAAPSPVFGERGMPGDRRYDPMGPPEVGRGYTPSPNRGPRSIRGSLYNDRVPLAAGGPRGPPEFPGDGSYSAGGNGLWDDHFQGDGRNRNR